MLGAFTRWFNDWALLLGWAVGIIACTTMAAAINFAPTYPLALGGFAFPGYTAFFTAALNLVLAVVPTPLFNAMSTKAKRNDETVEADYRAS
jgi:SSS family solute:Na+ symporter